MQGLDLNAPITYKHASLRFFEKNEYHVERFSRDNVLLLVFDGVLRFSEDGEEREIGAGEYYIQKKDCYQSAERPSDSPKYLYIHFDGEWTDSPDALSPRGRFDTELFSDIIRRIDNAAHGSFSYSEREYLFLKLLLLLGKKEKKSAIGQRLADYIEKNIATASLTALCETFHYSKNYVIRLFGREFGTSAVKYINGERIKRASYLLETTSKPIGEIAAECGFSDYPYFYKLFVKTVGESPQLWRKRMQEDPLG